TLRGVRARIRSRFVPEEELGRQTLRSASKRPHRQHTTESSVLPGLSCFALELVELGPLRFDELSVLDRERGAHDFAQFLGEDDSNCASLASVNRNGKGTGVAIVSINRALSFADNIGII